MSNAQVRSDGGEFPVRVWAHRPPPRLSLPQELNLGACLVGDAQAISFRCKNRGGHGKFRLLSPADYPSPSVAQRHLKALNLEPFNVTPTEFALGPGEECEIIVDYAPLALGEHRAQFIMVCDNCQVRRFVWNRYREDAKIVT